MSNDVVLRLKKISGQVDGIVKMVNKGSECTDVIVQFQAVIGALNRAFMLYLKDNLSQCVCNGDIDLMSRILGIITKR